MGVRYIERAYKFTYDALNRLTGATYGEGPSLASNLNRLNEVVTYNDKMGNIKTLIRRGKLDNAHYYYYLKDHQGNNRVVIDQGEGVQQVNHYYPFGGLFGEGVQTSNQPYKYSGKELDRFQGWICTIMVHDITMPPLAGGLPWIRWLKGITHHPLMCMWRIILSGLLIQRECSIMITP